jgi:hypothetical protein
MPKHAYRSAARFVHFSHRALAGGAGFARSADSALHYAPAMSSGGPSWLSLIGHVTDNLWSVDYDEGRNNLGDFRKTVVSR